MVSEALHTLTEPLGELRSRPRAVRALRRALMLEARALLDLVETPP